MAKAGNEELIYEQLINERNSIVQDQPVNVAFPPIDDNEIPFLLIYEASEEMHEIRIKKSIIEFLHEHNAMKITAYMNSSIYFVMKNVRTYTALITLNRKFKKFIEPLEKECEGRIFWIFNGLSRITDDKGGIRAAMRGRGNYAFYNAFKKWGELIINRL